MVVVEAIWRMVFFLFEIFCWYLMNFILLFILFIRPLGLQRHGNRRGPPRVPKEVESAMGVSEGKHSKRGPSSYNAHEVSLCLHAC